MSISAIHLAWAAQAGDSPICSYDLTRSTPLPTRSLGSPTTSHATDIEAPGSLAYSARANGCDGHHSDWMATTAQQLDLLQEGAPPLHYRGGWETVVAASASGGHVRRTTTAGSRLTYTFTGRDIALVAPACATCSAVTVSIDGARATTVSLHSSSLVPRTIHLLASFATSGRHTVTITAVARNGRTRVAVDVIIRLT